MNESRREFLKMLSAGTAALSLPFTQFSCGRLRNVNRPNVILIMTDDQGYGDLGVNGNPVLKTPNLDALSHESAQMTQFYVSPVCAPTRACLMTGRYNHRTRVIDTFLARSLMEPDEITLAEVLKNVGYATGIFGKWHLGDNYPFRPQDQGFEETLVHRGGGIAQPSDPPEGAGKYTDPVLFKNGEQVQEKGYCTDVYFNRGIEWMEKAHQQGKNFFMYLPTNAPHDPFHDVPEDLYEMYKSMDISNDRFPQTAGNPIPDNVDLDVRARAYAMITNIDENIGKLLTKLEQMNIASNTIVIFLVDNGHSTPRYAAGLRNKKTSVYEGGIRSPLFIRWPGKLKPGHKSDRIAAHIDLMPTILDACNLKVNEELKFDGKSILPLLTNQSTEWHDRNIVIQAHRGDTPVRYHNFALRNQRWKLVHASNFHRQNFEGEPKFELYDIPNDPFEMQDVAADHPEIVDTLTRAYDQWFDDVSSTRPNNYKLPRIHIGTPYENPVVLTRLDWRSTDNWGWNHANGYWMLYAANTGNYDVHVRCKPITAAGTAVLEIGGQTLQAPFAKGATKVQFKGIQLQQGNLNLQAYLKIPGEIWGAWQVDVIKT